MLSFLALVGVCHAGDLVLAVDPGDLAAEQRTFAVYQGRTYLGMTMVDGQADDDGGATLVVRYLPVGAKHSTWAEAISVDADGDVDKIVRREGRRIRVLTVGDGVVEEELREGGMEGELLNQRSLALGDASPANPWLVPLVLDEQRRLRKGDRWDGPVLDAAQPSIEQGAIVFEGAMDVGGGRVSDVAMLGRESQDWLVILDADGGVSAIVPRGSGQQWVAADRAQVQQTHAQAEAARAGAP